jgi:hypothetical protein|nr:MAG TPA: Endonuclease [Caudoviricetes sp.]
MRPFYKKVVIDNIKFDSEDEGRYYQLLKERESKGEIKNLEIHKPFLLIPEYFDKLNNKHNALYYEADFVYFDTKDNKKHVVDVKGFEEEHFKIKKKIFEYIYCYDDNNFQYDELEVLTYRKTLNSFVPLKDVKKLMKTKRKQLIEEKNYYKNIVLKQEHQKKIEENKKKREISRLKELNNLLLNGNKLTKQQKNRYFELKEKYPNEIL